MEGPTDWMQKQIIGRDQIKKAKLRKQNVPKIVDALQGILTTVVQQSAKNPSAIPKIITDKLNKSLKVDVTQNQEVFGDSVQQLVSALQAGRTDQLTDLLTAVVDKSFDVEKSSVSSKLIDALKQKIKGMDPAEARKTIVDLMIKQGRGLEEAEDIADEVLGPIQPTPNAEPDAEAEPAVPGQRMAKVYYPDGAYDEMRNGEQIAFLQNKGGGWSMMQMSKENEWAMIDKVEAGKTQQDIIKIIRLNQLEPVKLGFVLNQDNMWDVSKPPRAEK